MKTENINEKTEKKMIINGVEYIRKNSMICSNEPMYNNIIGKKVIVRSRNDGVNAGIVFAADSTGIILTNCRRLWYHKPADSSVSWYEGIAMYGISNDSKVSCTVEEKTIVESYSCTLCTDTAFDTIMGLTPYAGN